MEKYLGQSEWPSLYDTRENSIRLTTLLSSKMIADDATPKANQTRLYPVKPIVDHDEGKRFVSYRTCAPRTHLPSISVFVSITISWTRSYRPSPITSDRLSHSISWLPNASLIRGNGKSPSTSVVFLFLNSIQPRMIWLLMERIDDEDAGEKEYQNALFRHWWLGQWRGTSNFTTIGDQSHKREIVKGRRCVRGVKRAVAIKCGWLSDVMAVPSVCLISSAGCYEQPIYKRTWARSFPPIANPPTNALFLRWPPSLPHSINRLVSAQYSPVVECALQAEESGSSS